jgi:hypothetical protein
MEEQLLVSWAARKEVRRIEKIDEEVLGFGNLETEGR